MSEFAKLTTRQQNAHLMRCACEVLTRHGIRDFEIKRVFIGFNATFRVRAPGLDGALRLNVNSKRSAEQVRGELAIIDRVATVGKVNVPNLIPAFDGSAFTLYRSNLLGEKPVTLYRWVDGTHFKGPEGRRSARILGQSLRAVQDSLKGFELPEGTSRPVLNDVLDGIPWGLGEDAECLKALDLANQALRSIPKSLTQPIHFDLHFGNIKVNGDVPSVFDFDDAVIGNPAVDIAQSLYYLRSPKSAKVLEEAFREGLGWTNAELGVSQDQIEAMVAGRQLLLANDLLLNQTADIIEMIPKYTRVTKKRMKQFVDTGVFDPRIALMKDEPND